MKVCIVTTCPLETPGGVENVAKNIADNMKNHGIEAVSVSAYDKYTNPLSSFLNFRKIPKKLDKIKPDVIHTHDNSAFWLTKTSEKFIHTSHGTWNNYFSSMQNGVRDKLIKKYIVSMEKTIVNKATFNTAVSDFVKNSVVEQYGKKEIHVIRNGVDTKMFKPRKIDGEKLIWVGTNPKLKGLKIAEKAAEITGRKLIVAGVTGKSTERISYLGRVDPNAMKKIYDMSSVLIFPSFYESYPVVPLEAMAKGIPIVVSESSHVEIMKNGREGYIVKSHNPEDYAAAVEKAFKNMERLGKNARKTAEKYDWSRQIKKYIALYDKIV